MSRSIMRLVASGLAMALLSAAAAPIAAQESTPEAAAMMFPLVPDPADCQIEPRSTDELLALWFTPEGTPIPPATPMTGADADSVMVPLGPRADEDTSMALTALISNIFSCFAAGDFARATAYFSDDLTRGFGAEPGVSMEDARAFIETPPAPEAMGEQSQIVAISDVMELSDGRVGAIVVESVGGQQDAVYAIFERQGDQWVVDELIDFAPAEMEGEGS